MSNLKSTTSESFTSRLDIKMANTTMFEELIDVYAGTDVVVTAVGPSGIGKTAIPVQVAKRRGSVYSAFHGPTTKVEDFSIPTLAVDTRLFYDRRSPRSLQPLMEYCQKMREENGGDFPKGKNPILSIEELNRTVDKHVTRAFFVLIGDRVIGDLTLDPAIQIVVTMNPTGGGMVVNEFEKDPAMRRRLLLVGVTASYGDFIRHAKKAKFHQSVLDHIEAQPSHFYDHDAALAGKKFACPAAWEMVSKMCYALDAADKKLTSDAAQISFAGAIGATATEDLMNFLKDRTVVITPEEVITGYNDGSSVRDRFKALVEAGDNPAILNVTTGVVHKLLENTKRRPETFGKQLAHFMEDMPSEMMSQFVEMLYKQGQAASGGHQFVLKINQLIATEKYFNTAAQRLHEARAKGEKEAADSGFSA